MLSISFSGFLVQERLLVLGLKPGRPRFGCQLHKLDGHAFIPGMDFGPDVVILTITMGSVEASAAVGAFTGRTGRIVLLSSGDVYLAYARFSGIEPGPN